LIYKKIKLHTFNSIGGEEGQVLGFQRVVVGEFGASALGLGLSSEGRVVDLEAAGLDDADVSRNTVTKLDLYNVSKNNVLSAQSELLAFTKNGGKLKISVSY
jgi:hypothetical protein